jgi:AraC-like DNA-binding protein
MLLTASNLFQIILIVLSTLLGSYLLTIRRPIALAIFFLCFATQNSFYLINTAFPDMGLPLLGAAFRFIYGATIYFTVREMLYRDFRYRWHHLFHAIPFLIALLSSQSLFESIPISKMILNISLGILLLGYLFASFKLLNNYERVIADTRADGTSAIVIGLRRILNLFTALLIFELLRYGIGLTTKPAVYFAMHYLFTSIATIGLAALVLIALRRPLQLPSIDNEDIKLTEAVSKHLESLEELENQQDAPDIETPIDSQTAVPSSDRPVQMKSRTIDRELDYRLNRCMLEDKPYLDNQITIRQLAEQLQAPARAVSELINEAHRCNFSEFINKARIAEAQRLMQSSQWNDQSLLDIAIAAGFNSKTSFNTMFRRYTGLTPSDYRRQLDQGLKN